MKSKFQVQKASGGLQVGRSVCLVVSFWERHFSHAIKLQKFFLNKKVEPASNCLPRKSKLFVVTAINVFDKFVYFGRVTILGQFDGLFERFTA